MLNFSADDWSINIIDADNTLTWFFDTCEAAGPERCTFHAADSKVIRERYHAVETLVHSGTLILPDGNPLDASLFEASVHFLLYAAAKYPLLADILVSLEKGDVTPILSIIETGGISPYVTVALRCTDTVAVNDAAEELQEYSVRIGNVSRYLPAVWKECGYLARESLDITYSANTVSLLIETHSGWKVNPDNFKGAF